MLKTLERPAITVVGLAIRTRPMSPDIPALWPKFVARIDEIENLSEPRVSYGVMRHGGGDMEDLHYMAAVAVSNASRIPPGMESLTIPAGAYATFRYPLSGLARGFGEIFGKLLPSSGCNQAPGPYFDPGNPNSEVEIQIPVRR